MTITVRKLGGLSRAWFLATALLIAMAAALLQPSAALGASCSGAHQITLDRATITPASGSASTPFSFTVRYRDTANCVPRAVNLRIPDVGTFPMQQGSGKTFRQGVLYSVTLNLPAGRWSYWFAAAAGTGRGDKTVTLKVARAVAVAAVATLVPPTPAATPATGGPAPGSSPGPPATNAPGPGASAVPGGGGNSPPGDDSSGFGSQIPGIFGGPMGGVIGPWMVLTGVGMAIFWIILRRRPDSPMASAGTTAAGGAIAALGRAAVPPDAAVPRWLRPSLQAARQAGWGVPPPRAAVRFREAAALGVDRREIGYRLVRVADGPDDLGSEEIGRFDRGDQVEILESKGPFVRVRGADGLEGWVHQAAIVSILDN